MSIVLGVPTKVTGIIAKVLDLSTNVGTRKTFGLVLPTNVETDKSIGLVVSTKVGGGSAKVLGLPEMSEGTFQLVLAVPESEREALWAKLSLKMRIAGRSLKAGLKLS